MTSTEASTMAQWSQQFQVDQMVDGFSKGNDSGQNEAWEKARKALEKAQLSKSVSAGASANTAMTPSVQMGPEPGYFDQFAYWPQPQPMPMFNYPGFNGMSPYGYCSNYDMYGGYYGGQFGGQQIAQPQVNSDVDDSVKSGLTNQQQSALEIMNGQLYQNGFGMSQAQKDKQAPGSGNIRFSLPQSQNTGGNNDNSMYQKQPMGPATNNSQRGKGYQQQRGGGGAGRGGLIHQQQTQKWNQVVNKEEPTPPVSMSSSYPAQSFGNAMPQSAPPRSNIQPNKNENSSTGNGTPMDGSDWPESLRNYVNKAFNKCKTDLDKDQVEIILKGKLTKAYNDKTMWTKDWNNEPLPSIHSERILKESQITFGSPLSKAALPQLPESRLPSSPGLSSDQGFIPLNSSTNHNNNNKRFNKSSGSGSYKKKKKGFQRSLSRSRSRSRSPALPRPRKHRYTSGSSESSSSSSHNGRELSSAVSRKPALGSSVVSSVASRLGGNKEKGQGRGASPNVGKKNRNKKNKGPGFQHESFTVDGCLASHEKLQKRAARFLDDSSSGQQSGEHRKKNKTSPHSIVFTINNNNTNEELTEIDWEKLTVIGTCQDVEKPYLRLTTAPDPSTVRPVEVLRKALTVVKESWITNQDYHYACEQLKSIRQDLTVQCVRDAFTIQVYETHARIALEKGDHEEFNQCQTQLKALYDETGLDGNRAEFTGYRILYYMFAKNTLELKTLLAQLSVGEKQNPVINHALELLSSWLLSNYHRFFRLYSNAPKMAGYLIDWFVARERKNALKALIKSYRPTLSVSFIQNKLAFGTAKDCLAFLDECRVIFSCPKQTDVDCKGSLPALQAL